MNSKSKEKYAIGNVYEPFEAKRKLSARLTRVTMRPFGEA